jgi:hypothetical protein
MEEKIVYVTSLNNGRLGKILNAPAKTICHGKKPL